VTGYYQIISRYSSLAKVAITLCMLGLISGPAGGALACLTAALLPLAQFLIINNKCAIFAREANLHLREAVEVVNIQEGLENKGLIPRIFFVHPGFNENNAVFTSAPLIYGLDIFNTTPTLDFAKFAEDSLKWYRRDRCNVHLSIPFIPRGRAPIYCRLASVGHLLYGRFHCLKLILVLIYNVAVVIRKTNNFVMIQY
jgi:hypothetical protein